MFYVFARNAEAHLNASFSNSPSAYAFARRIARQFDSVEVHHDDQCLVVIRARKGK